MSLAICVRRQMLAACFAACLAVAVAAGFVLVSLSVSAQQQQQAALTAPEQAIADQIKTLRSLPDDVRATKTRDLASQIRALPSSPAKLRLAVGLASRATEGDFGNDTLQEVTTTLALALEQQPPPDKDGKPASAYVELAELVALRAHEGVACRPAIQGCHGQAGGR